MAQRQMNPRHSGERQRRQNLKEGSWTGQDDIFVIEYENFWDDFWSDFSKKHPGARMGFESRVLTHERLRKYRSHSKGVKLIPTLSLVEDLRVIKDSEEVEILKKALAISDKAFTQILKFIKPGMTEAQVAWKLESLMRDLGAEAAAWYPQIVGAGANSALPHHGHSEAIIKKGDLVQLDFGCSFQGYQTDTSRVVFMGKPTPQQEKIYNLVLEAQEMGIRLVKPGVRAGEIDQTVKEWLRSRTRGVYQHGLGHGVGLEIHEKPTLYTGVKDKLESGMVITIEPGVYLEGWGGVRLEDMVLVTDSGHEVLTKARKDIQHLIIDLKG